MRRSVTLTVLTATLLMVAGTAAAVDDNMAELQASLDKWDNLKQKCGGNYRYFVRTSSFTGAGTETEIVIRNNKVAGRRYKVTGPPVLIAPTPNGEPPKPEAPTYKWTERGEEVGNNKDGAPAKTLDELYAQAKEVLVRELPEHEKLYVRFDKQGLLSSCFTVDTRIADDAPTNGVIISEIRLEEK